MRKQVLLAIGILIAAWPAQAQESRGAILGRITDVSGAIVPDGSVQVYLRDPGGNLVEVDVLGASRIAADVRRDMKRLADAQPQSEENLRAHLLT